MCNALRLHTSMEQHELHDQRCSSLLKGLYRILLLHAAWFPLHVLGEWDDALLSVQEILPALSHFSLLVAVRSALHLDWRQPEVRVLEILYVVGVQAVPLGAALYLMRYLMAGRRNEIGLLLRMSLYRMQLARLCAVPWTLSTIMQ
jgi:hypothetical protein